MATIVSISILFCAWKTVLLFLTWGAPGPGYDTSTCLIPSFNKLVRWDAIYYVQTARRGLIFEQEWAFGKGLSTLLAGIAGRDLDTIIVTGIVVSHLTHYIAVILLWRIAILLFPTSEKDGQIKRIPFIAACLHIISPAGIFLSAPYSESPFSCMNMLGFWLYLKAQMHEHDKLMLRKSFLLVASGMSFGSATLLRSNGILSGLPFLVDAIEQVAQILGGLRRMILDRTRATLLFAVSTAGVCVGAGLILPQYLAYREYCEDVRITRPWCQRRLPLIYSFVQSHYWGVGFLRYWTFSNLPLFLLAMPSLALLLYSSFAGIQGHKEVYAVNHAIVSRLAMPQLVLAVLAITNYHVQIITRLASGYPWLYIWLAEYMCSRPVPAKLAVRTFVLYAMIQAVLFASFLPPA